MMGAWTFNNYTTLTWLYLANWDGSYRMLAEDGYGLSYDRHGQLSKWFYSLFAILDEEKMEQAAAIIWTSLQWEQDILLGIHFSNGRGISIEGGAAKVDFKSNRLLISILSSKGWQESLPGPSGTVAPSAPVAQRGMTR
ncbi:hypothetical protein DKX38_015590 [Salix brachista]|uniref:Uncharacterized protein n=1 Tax=Salix brachista TaxID=2182728 RepID=A0A5N5L5M2_9ROSI|nr:hypothetical protein DKX38_015590 [Salix brachista]